MSRTTRRCLLQSAAVATVPLAGCLSELSTDGAGTEMDPDRRVDCEYATRPPAEADASDEVSPAPYPDPPTHPAPTDWVVEHERAYSRNEALGEYDVQSWSGFVVEETEREERSSGVVVRVAYTLGMMVEEGAIDYPVVTAAYYVDEYGAVRATDTGGNGELDSGLDPTEDGSRALVVCF